MPLVKLYTSANTNNCKEELLKAMSSLMSKSLGKPEQYVMAIVVENTMMMSGSSEPSAFVDIRSIGGLNPDVNKGISKELCAILQDKLEIPANRVFMNFTDVPRGNWGWNASTFG